jgi:aminomethyltransferase
MKYTALKNTHEALGAKMVEFAGYLMPMVYSSINEEHMAVRGNVGVFDVSHMGEFIIKGRQALDLIQKVSSNDAKKLAKGQAQYACLPNKEGGIIDDLLVYRLPEDQCAEGEKAFMLVVNASNIQKDWDWIQQAKDEGNYDTRMIDISDQTGLLAVQGPGAAALLKPLTDIELATIPYYSFVKGKVAGIENVLISATGYTGSGGFELYVDKENLRSLWYALFAEETEIKAEPCGLGARDTLRLEMGYCLYGNDIDDTTSPLEAGLGWITRTDKEDFYSRDIFLKQKEEGVERKLCGFVVNDRRVPRHDYPILDKDGNSIGKVTSGTMSPLLQQPIGLGYVQTALAKPGTAVRIDMGRKTVDAEIVKLPFYKP